MKIELQSKKPWGSEQILQINPRYVLKRITMKKGHQCSYQFHKKKHETIYALKGRLTVVIEGAELILNEGEHIDIKPKTKHRMRATRTDCVYLEASTPELHDIVRLDDDYNRV